MKHQELSKIYRLEGSGPWLHDPAAKPRFKSGWWILPAVVMGLAIVWGLV